ncbi:MAG TPA: M56 family metallopeptidase [Longimicrobium sp.]|jgi:hypothetical protein|uniref:M56 family metallopeptidase n=1 Tax=Longimicrobium sp. TaxID=2029185 RepID=UPI002EDB92B7
MSTFLSELLLRGLLLVALASVAALLLAAAAARARASLWQTTTVLLACLPLLMVALPAWRVGVPVHRVGIGLAGWEPRTGVDGAAAGCPSADAACAAGAQPAGRERKGGAPWAVLWTVGALALAARTAGGVLTLRSLARGAAEVQAGGWVSILDDARRDAGIGRRVRLLVAAGETAVLTWGVRRPAILLPASASAWSAERMRAVILHELQHVRRRDALYDVAAQVALVIHWPNPLAWYAVGRLRSERERACDSGVVAAGISPLSYAGHLVDLARTMNRGASHGLAVIGAGAGFEGRVVTLMRQRPPAVGGRSIAWIAAAAAALLGTGSAVVRPELSFAAPARFVTDVGGSDASYLSRHYGIPVELSRTISRAADAEGVDRVLAHALVHAQSGFHREAAGPGVGLTRITPATAARHAPGVTPARLREDETNLKVGFRYLAALIRHYDGEVDAALAAYHLGPGVVGASRGPAKAASGAER